MGNEKWRTIAQVARVFHTMCSTGLRWLFLSSLLSSVNVRPDKEHEKLLSWACTVLSIPPISDLTQHVTYSNFIMQYPVMYLLPSWSLLLSNVIEELQEKALNLWTWWALWWRCGRWEVQEDPDCLENQSTKWSDEGLILGWWWYYRF